MISGVSGTSSLSYLWQLKQASKNTGTSADSLFSSLDTNGDSSISKSELSSALSNSLLASSVLGSGSDSTSSLVSLLEKQLAEGTTSPTGSNSTDSTGRLSAEEMFKKTDVNGDGSLDKTEFENGRPSHMTLAQADELYSKLDTNKDGSISESEFITKGPGGHNGPPPPDSMGGTSGNTNTSSSDALSTMSLLMQAIGKYAKAAVVTAGSAALVA
ncbi:MAG: hypothetical protein C0399_09075 [Syntrophus sp. (in: bacteria)]|nr:hypothetical protein [Syntrophus sp. (in: bacteria)]